MKKEEKIQENYVPRHLKKETIDTETVQKQKKTSRQRKTLYVLLAVSMFFIFAIQSRVKNLEADDVAQEQYDPMPEEYRNVWLEHKAINSDYVGEIVFDSGLISLPFVQAKDVYDESGKPYVFYTSEGDTVVDVDEYTGNDVYIWKNWKTGEYDRYEEGGSIFMDCRNSLDDQNLILYGHHFARDFDPSGSKQFTPLDLLLEKENYDQNRSLKLILNHEIRSYEVCAVAILDVRDEEQLQLVNTDLNESSESFENYADLVAKLSRYITGIRIQEEDRILSMITCIEHRPELRQAVICREISRKEYSD